MPPACNFHHSATSQRGAHPPASNRKAVGATAGATAGAGAASNRAASRGAEIDVVAIPGAEDTLGTGDPRRALTLSAADHFHGAHTNNSAYFARRAEPLASCGKVLRLRSVCWLAVGGTLKDVPSGKWECILRCRLTRGGGPNFVGDWKIGVGVRHTRDFAAVDECGARHLRNDHSRGRGGALLKSLPTDRFSALSFGVLQLESPSDVRFEMGGGSPYWCSDLEFDALELRPVGPPWAVVRLLLLGADSSRQPGDHPERPGCEFARLPPDVLQQIVMLL